ncbi:hypothetical protein, partial [Phascolarctobacterium succinatutens]|uniref:hypothetical protein n=1 Tax=Phascolarctobacterium succinatutens TaxID=626940 RepID=UPI0026EA07C8
MKFSFFFFQELGNLFSQVTRVRLYSLFAYQELEILAATYALLLPYFTLILQVVLLRTRLKYIDA